MKKSRGLRSLRAKRNVQKSREFKPAIRFGEKARRRQHPLERCDFYSRTLNTLIYVNERVAITTARTFTDENCIFRMHEK